MPKMGIKKKYYQCKKTKQKNNPVQQKLGTKNNEKHFSA